MEQINTQMLRAAVLHNGALSILHVYEVYLIFPELHKVVWF